MPKRKIIVEEDAFTIQFDHKDGTRGWLVGEEGRLLTFPDEKLATKYLSKMKASGHYSMNCEASVVNLNTI